MVLLTKLMLHILFPKDEFTCVVVTVSVIRTVIRYSVMATKSDSEGTMAGLGAWKMVEDHPDEASGRGPRPSCQRELLQATPATLHLG